MINKVSDTEMVDGARDFRLMTRQVVDAILELKEVNRFSKNSFLGSALTWPMSLMKIVNVWQERLLGLSGAY
ncbi:MAG: hypothetical protein ACLTZB_02450 [Streptococcus salivarius]